MFKRNKIELTRLYTTQGFINVRKKKELQILNKNKKNEMYENTCKFASLGKVYLD